MIEGPMAVGSYTNIPQRETQVSSALNKLERETQVSSALNKLERVSEELHMTIEKLEGRLVHVRNEVPRPPTANGMDKSAAPLVGMALRIERMCDVIMQAQQRIASLEKELEL